MRIFVKKNVILPWEKARVIICIRCFIVYQEHKPQLVFAAPTSRYVSNVKKK